VQIVDFSSTNPNKVKIETIFIISVGAASLTFLMIWLWQEIIGVRINEALRQFNIP